MATKTKIWRKIPEAATWKMERECDVATAHQWLLDAKAQRPDAEFKISQERPVR